MCSLNLTSDTSKMKENERESIAAAAMLTACAAAPSPYAAVRPLSAATLSVLSVAGCPYYNAIIHGETISPSALDMLVFVWAHVAPWAEVRKYAVAGTSEAIMGAALDFGQTMTAERLGELTIRITEQVSAAQKLLAVPEGEEEETGKNE